MHLRTVAALIVFLLSHGAFAQTINNLGSATTLSGTESVPLFQGANPAVKTTTAAMALLTTNFADPVLCCNAAGVITTTTGTISASSTSLVVASATGWSVGMGIAVANAGTGGNTELITTVTAIAGTTFTLNNAAVTTATGQTVNHDDTAAIAAAIATGKGVHLRAGNYHVTSGFTIGTAGNSFVGDGRANSIIWNRSTTADIFTINYEVAGGTHYIGTGALFQDFQISQKAGITPTAGYGFKLASASGNGFYVIGAVITRINFNQLWGGISIGTGVISNWYSSLYMSYLVGGNGILVNSVSPSGDNNFLDIEMSGTTTGVTITAADTQQFTNLKLNGSSMVFNGAVGQIARVRIINPSLESGAGNCGIDFGSNAYEITIVGGGIGLVTNPLCNAANVTKLSVVGTTFYPTGTFGAGFFKAFLPSAAFGTLGAGAAVADNEVGMTKMTASGVASGAGTCKEAWVAGTNAGSCKKIAYCGTSTTPVTIIDNVGSGC